MAETDTDQIIEDADTAIKTHKGVLRLKAELAEAAATITRLRSELEAQRECVAALRPFVAYRRWARRNEWPADIAGDPNTPVHGRDDESRGSFALYVRDYDRADAAITALSKLEQLG